MHRHFRRNDTCVDPKVREQEFHFRTVHALNAAAEWWGRSQWAARPGAADWLLGSSV
jgi:hypothetical protein